MERVFQGDTLTQNYNDAFYTLLTNKNSRAPNIHLQFIYIYIKICM